MNDQASPIHDESADYLVPFWRTDIGAAIITTALTALVMLAGILCSLAYVSFLNLLFAVTR